MPDGGLNGNRYNQWQVQGPAGGPGGPYEGPAGRRAGVRAPGGGLVRGQPGAGATAPQRWGWPGWDTRAPVRTWAQRASGVVVPTGVVWAAARRRRLKRTAPAIGAGYDGDLVLVGADLSKAMRTRYLWAGRVLLGYFNLMLGEEGVGKGVLMSWLGAGLTNGTLDGEFKGTPKSVLIVGDEDSWRDIWTPRLAVAGEGADMSRCFRIEGTKKGDIIDIKQHGEEVWRAAEAYDAGLVYFDQFLDNMGYADNWKEKEVRQVVSPLRRAFADKRVALLGTCHPNKRRGSFRDRVSGSPALSALSRSGLLVAEHPSAFGAKVVVRGKGNYAGEPDAFEFEIEGADVQGNERLETQRLHSPRETGLTRDNVLGLGTAREGTATSDAEQFLRAYVVGEPKPRNDVQEAAWELHAINYGTLNRARNNLGMVSRRNGRGEYLWYPVGTKVHLPGSE